MERNSLDGPSPQACTTPDCCGSPSRREFLQVVGLGGMAALTAGLPAVAGPFEGADFEKLVPADKKLRPDWLRSLVTRGQPTVHRGAELEKIGMPVGGIGAGQLYLGGDGKLWHWDLFNLPQTGNFTSGSGPNFARPPQPTSPLEQGFALRVAIGDEQSHIRVLDQRGFNDIVFRGQYPIGFVDYHERDLPVSVSLEAFSPFIPLNVEDSTLPATVMRFTVKNTGSLPVQFGVAGWLENAVCLGSGRQNDGLRRNHVLRERGLTLLHCTAEAAPKKDPAEKRPDILFEDFEKETYEGWKVEGTAFGRGPVKRPDIPAYMGDLGGKGQRVVNSHASAPGKNVRERDAQTGKLTSKPFRIDRGYINFFIGGGAQPGKTCLNLLVDGKVVRTATGQNKDHMEEATFDVHVLQGKQATIEIVDAATGHWGNVGVDHIVFSDTARAPFVLDQQADYGSMALAVLGASDGSFARASVPLDDKAAQASFSPDVVAGGAARPFNARLGGAVGRGGTLKPGEQADVTFLVTWYFPRLPPHRFDRLVDANQLRRSYATRFDSAAAVARYVAKKFDELAGQTRLWNKTWYDSTLPYWFLDRTFLTVDCLATGMAYHFNNGRFYAFEGTYCCDGTCTHVWQYAHAMARLFPALERATREMVDYGIAFHPDSGAMDYRAEYDRRVAHDGQAGTILRAYREHQMAADDQFLRRYWPKIKQSIEYLINRDVGRDGLLDGEQYNTLDASWYGHIAWISSLYLACVRAGAAMARELGDEAFAKRCDAINEQGNKNMVAQLFNGEYFIQVVDPEHLKAINTNEGCHIDQVFGESWAFQVGLPRVLPAAPTKSALEALWKYNFTPDVGPYRREFKVIPGGRWYAMPGEGGLLMCTWPKGGADRARGEGTNPGFVGYFNECMTGFEYQVAAHMVWEGLVEKGLAITRMIHDRYHALRHNPWNEVECGDHYARAMASYGVFLAACGFEYHGPKGHLGFAPRLTPEKFRAPFTAAEGWGTFTQERAGTTQRAILDVHWGRLRLRTLTLELPADARPAKVIVRTGEETLAASHRLDGSRCTITLGADTIIAKGHSLHIDVE